jgi:soluble lytic murein transglycosylase
MTVVPLRSPALALGRVLRRGMALAACAGFSCFGLPPAAAQTDADFLAAREAFDRGDKIKLDALAPSLKGHVLTPYVTYWQLKLGIDDADHDAVRGFLTQYPNTPLAERLRVEWLKSSAKRGDWARFALDYPPPAGEDVELTCYGIQYRLQRDGSAALLAAKALWFTGQTTPEACDPLFGALFAKGDLTHADRRARFRLAGEAGNVRLAQAMAAEYPANDRPTPKELAEIDRDPARALAKGSFVWKAPSGQDLALYALERGARKDADGVRAAWVKWRERLPKSAQQYGNARLAFHAARQLNPLAHAWFREAGATPLAPEQQAWRIRSALRVLAWADVRAAIDALPDRDRQDPAWRYWKGRALAAQGSRTEAEALFASLAGDIHFYGLLAGEALGRGAEQLMVVKSEPAQPATEALAAFGARPEVRRVLKLAELDLRLE